ncbi:hypothetical protein [Sutcliffiella cohnii]|uniref:hypothetical protein n=1 Tax=Sutcliffiella cohnii TaxID=33932 RepID=UPI002E251F2E|nr:hypothetical protein [Sutcliffiella cohnii]
MTTTKTMKAIEDKQKIIEFEQEVEGKTFETYTLLKRLFKKEINTGNENISIITENDYTFEVKVFDTIIGCSMIEGVALLKEEEFISDENFERIRMASYKKIINDENLNGLITGMIIFYSKTESTKNIVLGRFFVNNYSDIFYKTECGWKQHEYYKGDNVKISELTTLIELNINNALFEGTIYWKNDNLTFDNIRELGIGNKIGF